MVTLLLSYYFHAGVLRPDRVENMNDHECQLVPKKKKKKKFDNKLEDLAERCSTEQTDIMNNDDDICQGSTIKKKKRKGKEVEICNSTGEIEQNGEGDMLPRKKKKKAKKGDLFDEYDSSSETVEVIIKKKKKKHRKEKDNSFVDCDKSVNCDQAVVECSSGKGEEEMLCCDSVEKRVKKKKKKRKHKDESIDEDMQCVGETVNEGKKEKKRKKHKRREESSDGETVHDVAPLCNARKDKKKKPKLTEEGSDGEIIQSDVTPVDHVDTGKKKKNKKKTKVREESVGATSEEMIPECEEKTKKKKKHKPDKVAEESIEDMSQYYAKHKSAAEHSRDRPVSYNRLPFDYSTSDVGQKNYNTKPFDYGKDEQNTNKTMSADVNAGQWKTAALGSDERQQKFLRLLGGFKKSNSSGESEGGLFGKLGSLNSNYAMNKREEEKFNKNLENDYDRALSFKFSKQKSIGLGFEIPPGEGKKFFIDKTSSRSVKFDDSD